MEKKRGEAIQRTLVLTMEEEGEAVAHRLTQILDQWDNPPVVAVRHLAEDQHSWKEVVDEALQEVSRASHLAVLSRLGYRLDRLEELVIWVVGPPQAPLAEVATETAEKSIALLGIDPLALGLILCDASIDVSSMPDIPFEGEVAALNGPCYLISPIDEVGLVLDDAQALIEQAACFLALHTFTPLRDTPAWIEQANGWTDKARYASFGLRRLTWPGDVAQAQAAHRLGKAVLEKLVGDAWEKVTIDALLREAALPPPSLAHRLIPQAAIGVIQAATDEPPGFQPWILLRPSGKGLHPLLTQIEERARELTAALDRCAPAWEPKEEAEIREATSNIRTWIAQALDEGGIHRARALIKGLAWHLDGWVIGAEQRLMEAEKDLTHISEEIDGIKAALGTLTKRMPRRQLRPVLKLLRNPFRWIWLWNQWQRAKTLYHRWMTRQAAAVETRVVAHQMTHAVNVYLALSDVLETTLQEVNRLEDATRDLLAADSPPDWPASFLLGDDPDELLTRLEKRILSPIPVRVEAFSEQWGSLSSWWRKGGPERDQVAGWLSEQVAPLATCSIWDVVRCRFPQPDVLHTWLEEWIQQIHPLWRWDPAALSEGERSRVGGRTVFLAPPDSLRLWGEDVAGPCVLPLSQSDLLAGVALRWGISWIKISEMQSTEHMEV